MPPKQPAKGTQSQRGSKRKASGKPPFKSPPHKRRRTEASTSRASRSPQVHGASTLVKAHEVPSTFNIKVSSWNVNGIRSWIERNGLEFLQNEAPDIFCLQETKCPGDRLPDEVRNIQGYHSYWAVCTDAARYSGVGLISKEEPIDVTYGIGVEEHDLEGRVITAEYPNFYLVTAYVPNSGTRLVGLAYRMQWDVDFFKYLKSLLQQKEVILCGDLNVAHQEIDIANPNSNSRNSGFTNEERESFGSLLDSGFTDTFRYLYPDTTMYSFWEYIYTRSRNIGWRLDYFVCSEGLKAKVHDSIIHTDVMGSDHCPVSLQLQI